MPDHDRVGTHPLDLDVEYGAYVASFDSAADDEGDGTADLGGVPEWVAYATRQYGEDTGGQFHSRRLPP